MTWLTPKGSLTPDDIYDGLRVLIHYTFGENLTGTIVKWEERQYYERDNFADVSIDGYDGKLVIPALIAEMDRLNFEPETSNA